jgi:hypothetical protein
LVALDMVNAVLSVVLLRWHDDGDKCAGSY